MIAPKAATVDIARLRRYRCCAGVSCAVDTGVPFTIEMENLDETATFFARRTHRERGDFTVGDELVRCASFEARRWAFEPWDAAWVSIAEMRLIVEQALNGVCARLSVL